LNAYSPFTFWLIARRFVVASSVKTEGVSSEFDEPANELLFCRLYSV
jgi:hypothetical protein